ncbi:DNA helicase [Tanacetum coccineum]
MAPKTDQNEKSLGRLIYVHPSSCDLFYLRMLLCHQKGCKSPVELRIVHDHILPTYRDTCEALGLLGDDKEWDITLEESDVSGSSAEIISLFSQILIYCDIADPGKLWTKHWQTIRDDIPAKVSKETGIPNYHAPIQHLLEDLKNKLLMEDKNYKRDLLMQEFIHSVPKLNHDQKKIYDLIINASATNQQELLFVYGHVALSGIASPLLPAGRTAHYRFKHPLELTNESLCHAKKKSRLGNLLVEMNLIIWDEAPMNDMRCFETLDRTLRDLMNAPEVLFRGKTVVLGGNGEIGELDEEENQVSSWITIPPEYFVTANEIGMEELIDFIYDEATLKTPTA